MVAKRPHYGLPTVNALRLAHMKRITDRLGDFEPVVWIDGKRRRELLGGPGKLGKDEYPRVSGILCGNIFLRNQVHAIPHRCDKPDGRKSIKAGQY